MKARPLTLEQVKEIKRRHESELLCLSGVIGVGIGQADSEDSTGNSHDFCIVITIVQDSSPDEIPAALEGVPVRIMTVGTFRALDNGL